MFGAVDFRGLGQQGRAPPGDQPVDRRAERGVCGNARIAVRPAALQPDRQLRCTDGGPPVRIHDGEEFDDQFLAAPDGSDGPTLVLDRHGFEAGAGFQPLDIKHARDLVRLATETDQQHAPEIGMPRIAAERPAQHHHSFSLGIHAAARAVGDRHDAIDMGEVTQPVAEPIGNGAADHGGAVHRGNDADIVTGTDTAVWANIAFEGRRNGARHRG